MLEPRIAALETHFREVAATSMRDIPILNPRLQVEAVDFQEWEQGCLGVLITPWFMNLLWLPALTSPATALGAEQVLHLPAGEYDFHRNHSAGVGVFYSCSLFSPVLEFVDQQAAVLTAQQVMLKLMEEAPATQPAQAPTPLPNPEVGAVSRRDFLRGKFT